MQRVFQQSAEDVAFDGENLGSPAEQMIKQGPASQGGEPNNKSFGSKQDFGNSFRSEGSRVGYARMSSGDFERESDDNDDQNANIAQVGSAEANDQIKPILATPAKTQCYRNFESHPVRVEGPEFNRDFTYYLVDKMPDLNNFERGIPLDKFKSFLNQKRIELEFRTLQKMCFHKDHVLNLFTSFDIQFHKINRYKDILPFLHNRVILKENPVLPMPAYSAGDGSSDEADSKRNGSNTKQMIDNMIDIHGSDARLQTYFNASYINSMIKSNQEQGSSYIASSSPGLKTQTSRANDDDPEPGAAGSGEPTSPSQDKSANQQLAGASNAG